MGTSSAPRLAVRYRNGSACAGPGRGVAGEHGRLVGRAGAATGLGAAHRNQRDVAVAVQSSVSALLAQSVKSLAWIGSIHAPRPHARRRCKPCERRSASIPSPPISACASAASPLVDARGKARDDLKSQQAVPVLSDADAGAPVRFGALLQMRGDPAWYVPVAVPVGRPSGDAIAFAPVPTDRLLGAASSLKVLPGGFVTLFTVRSGTRLFRQMIADDVFRARRPPVPLFGALAR